MCGHWPLRGVWRVGEGRMETEGAGVQRPQKGVSSGVELRREGPTLSLHLLCARSPVCLISSSDPARQAWVLVSQVSC